MTCVPWFYSNYCIVKPLTYYSKDQLTLGSLEHLQTTHIQEVEHKGAYSIYFIVIKADLHRRLDYSLYHFLHIKKTDLYNLRPDYSHYRFLHDRDYNRLSMIPCFISDFIRLSERWFRNLSPKESLTLKVIENAMMLHLR